MLFFLFKRIFPQNGCKASVNVLCYAIVEKIFIQEKLKTQKRETIMKQTPAPISAVPKPRFRLTMDNVRWFLMLNLGLILTAAGIHFFKSPNHFAIGGTSGISIIAATLFPKLNVGDFMFIVNAVLIVLGFIFLGIRSMGATIYSSFALSFYVWIFERIYMMTAPFTQDTMLELCFAVLLPAAGSAIVFNIGSSTGGTDIVAMILSKHTSLEIGKALMVSDFLIAASTIWIYDVRTGLYCLLGLLVKSTVVDLVIDSLNTRKQVTIISSAHDAVLKFITEKLHRGATLYSACGAYTHKAEVVILTVLSRREAMLLRNFLRKTDPKAFLTIVNSSETIGKGFRAL